jgi:hypothetical protein
MADLAVRFNALEQRIRALDDPVEMALRPDLLADAIGAVLDLDFVEFEVVKALASALGVCEDPED